MRHQICRSVTLGMLLLMVGWMAGCGGSGSSSGDTPTGPSPMIVLTPDGGASGATVTMRSAAGSDPTLLTLEIVATGLTNVQTLDFTVSFPANLLRFEEARLGDFLGNGANQIVQSAVGGVIFQMTAPGVTASGSGVVTTLDLRAIASGNGRLEFVDPEAGDSLGLEIEGIDWLGGAVQVAL